MNTAALIYVHGMVQGVGYRYFALLEAQRLNLRGYIRNNKDGTVESFVEGTKNDIMEYVAALERGPILSHVSGTDVEWHKFEDKFSDFRIVS
jgi:acylphosphatase